MIWIVNSFFNSLRFSVLTIYICQYKYIHFNCLKQNVPHIIGLLQKKMFKYNLEKYIHEAIKYEMLKIDTLLTNWKHTSICYIILNIIKKNVIFFSKGTVKYKTMKEYKNAQKTK